MIIQLFDQNPASIISYHRYLVGDKIRTRTFKKAIFKTVKTGSTVLDIGSGSGILSFFARAAGAAKVYSVESENVIEMAKCLSAHNQFDDRVEFLHQTSDQVKLSPRADVLVTETLGNFGLEEGIISTVIDARKRLLKPGAKIIPGKVELILAPVEFPDFYKRISFWKKNLWGVDFTPMRQISANNFHYVIVYAKHFLSEPKSLVKINLQTVKNADFSKELKFSAKRSGLLHGFAGWFSAELTPGLFVTNAPPRNTPSWKQIFFPLEMPISIRKGQTFKVRIKSGLNGNLWAWQVELGGQRYKEQSTFSGFPMSKERFALNLAVKPSTKALAGKQ